MELIGVYVIAWLTVSAKSPFLSSDTCVGHFARHFVAFYPHV